MKKPVLAFLFIISSLFSYSQSAHPYIHDESYTDISFFEFKTRLTTAVLQKDTAALFGMFADSVWETDYACDRVCSKEEFKESIGFYGHRRENTDWFWDQMLLCLRYGFFKTPNGGFGNRYLDGPGMNYMVAPSYRGHIDNFDSIIVLANNVNIRKAPMKTAEAIANVSFVVLATDSAETENPDDNSELFPFVHRNKFENTTWICVNINGQKGYVAEKLTSHYIYKTLMIIKINGQWKVVSFYNPPGC